MLVIAAEEGVKVVGKSKVTVNINVAPRSDLDRCSRSGSLSPPAGVGQSSEEDVRDRD